MLRWGPVLGVVVGSCVGRCGWCWVWVHGTGVGGEVECECEGMSADVVVGVGRCGWRGHWMCGIKKRSDRSNLFYFLNLLNPSLPPSSFNLSN